MKILLCHNYYQQTGGEDGSFAGEAALLERNGHEVLQFTAHNDTINDMSRWKVARETIWNRSMYQDLRTLIRRERPAVMHCTNTFPLISPAAYYAARAEGLTVVQSLRNYRLLCPNGLFLRDGKACEDCLGKAIPWPGIFRACYRQSVAASAVTATMLGVHRALRTWTRIVSRYVALTEFSRQKFVQGGLPVEKVAVKPNFVYPDPGPGSGSGRYAVFVGRLSVEKGLDTLLTAWDKLGHRYPLKIIGDGPLDDLVRSAAEQHENIDWLGRLPVEEILSIVGEARCLVIPSVCYEGLPRTIIEAFSKGTPVVASRLGSMAEIVDDGRTGAHFEPGNPDDLAAKLEPLLDESADLTRMREAVRNEFETKYTAESNYRILMDIYASAIGNGNGADKAIVNRPKKRDREVNP